MDSLSKQLENFVISTAWRKRHSEILDTPEILRLANPSTPYFFLNGIYRTQITENAEQKIREHWSYFKSQNINFRWYTFPHSEPLDLSSHLEKLNPIGFTEMLGLYFDIQNQALEINSHFRVEKLSKENIDDYCRVNSEGWNQTGDEAKRISDNIRADFQKITTFQPYLTYFNDEPAGTGMLLVQDKAGYLFGGSTSPRFRGKGVYKALVYHRLNEMRAMGVKRGFILARKATSAPICLKLGFQKAFEARTYEF